MCVYGPCDVAARRRRRSMSSFVAETPDGATTATRSGRGLISLSTSANYNGDFLKKRGMPARLTRLRRRPADRSSQVGGVATVIVPGFGTRGEIGRREDPLPWRSLLPRNNETHPTVKRVVTSSDRVRVENLLVLNSERMANARKRCFSHFYRSRGKIPGTVRVCFVRTF